MPPRIGFNMWQFSSTRAGGSYYYAMSLLHEFVKSCPEEIVVLHGTHNRNLIQREKVLQEARRLEIGNLSEILNKGSEFDVLFTPGPWRWYNIPDIPTVHYIPDIQEYFHPEFFSRLELVDRFYYRPYIAQSSTMLVTVSHYSMDAISRTLGVRKRKIRVVYPGCNPVFGDCHDFGIKPDKLPRDLGPYLFYPANSWKHKNHKRLLDAVALLGELHGKRVPCILTGHTFNGEFNNVDLNSEIHKRGLQNLVYHLGRVNLFELKYLYRHALALIFPSLYEGFGIPVLEAMSCGCPVIASNRTSIPEVAKDAALYFNPEDPHDIAEKIMLLFLKQEEAAKRVERGKILSHNFSYQRQYYDNLDAIECALEYFNSATGRHARKNGNRQTPETALTVLLFPDVHQKNGIREWFSGVSNELRQLLDILVVSRNRVICRFCREELDADKEAFIEKQVSKGLLEALAEIRTEFVLLSDGKTWPQEIFLNHMATKGEYIYPVAELLHGDSYYIDKSGKNIRTDLVPSGTEDDDRKPYCIRNLCFVIRKAALIRVLEDFKQPLPSVRGLAEACWDSCTKSRIYWSVSSKKIMSGAYLDPSLGVMISAMARHSDSPLARSLGNNNLVQTILTGTLALFNMLPQELQSETQRIYKILASSWTNIIKQRQPG